MKMTWRWYGKGNDSITLDHIRQIPGVMGVVWSLHDKVAGEIWEMDRIQEVVDQITSKGFSPVVVESVNVHENLKNFCRCFFCSLYKTFSINTVKI